MGKVRVGKSPEGAVIGALAIDPQNTGTPSRRAIAPVLL